MFDVLYDATGPDRFDLPEDLADAYGAFGLPSPVVFANMVSSIDGAVALPGVEKSSQVIAGGNPADRFLVALLRAVADAVVVGAGTYRAHRGPWTAEKAFAERAASFGELRRSLALAPEPVFVVVTRSGDLGEPRPSLRGAVIVAPAASRDRLGAYAEAGAEIVTMDTDEVDVRAVVHLLRDRGCGRILTEGGPGLLGRFLRAGILDELFLTVSPLVFGGGDPPPVTLAGSVGFDPPLRAERLLSARRAGDHLFWRYSMRGGEHHG